MRRELQHYILLRVLEKKGRLSRRGLEAYYELSEKKPKRKDQVDAITKTLERLIDHGILIGIGVRTRSKWFIKEVRLTPKGQREALRLLGEQQKLPFLKKTVF